MPITLYRAEKSTPHEIQARGGFRAWVPLPLATAQDLINRCNGNAGAGIVIALPSPADTSPLQATLNLQTRQNLGALMQNIKLEKNQTTVHISCDSDMACGGYDGYIYQMTFPNLNYQANGAGPVIAAVTANDLASLVNPRLVFDGPGLDASQYVALARGAINPGVEVAFLTSIPYALITGYLQPNDPRVGAINWRPMP